MFLGRIEFGKLIQIHSGFLLLLFCSLMKAQDFVALDKNFCHAYEEVLNLHIDVANQEIKKNKNNIANCLIENYIDFLELTSYENESRYKYLKHNKDQRINKINDSKIPESWKNYLKADILLQWTLLHLKFDDTYQAFISLKSSLALLDKNKRLYPEFFYTYKSIGILHAVLSTIPNEVKWIGNLIGLEGDLALGKSELTKFIEFAKTNNDVFYKEALASMGYIISNIENNPAKAIKYWITNASTTSSVLENIILCILNLKAQDNEKAIHLLHQIPQYAFRFMPILYYYRGQCKLQKLDYTGEFDYLDYIKKFSGKSYIKDSYQKLYWIAYLTHQNDKYTNYKIAFNSINKVGGNEDINALIHFDQANAINEYLLKARILCDGGYFKRAYNILFDKLPVLYADENLKVEAAYRMARICQTGKQYHESLTYFQDVIQFDKEGKTFMYANALLQIAYIYVILADMQQAKLFFEKALHSQPEYYAKSIHQKAKAALLLNFK